MVWLGWALSLVLLGVGFLGVWLPAVPGLALMALGAFVHKLLVPGVLSWWVVAVFAFVAALGFGFGPDGYRQSEEIDEAFGVFGVVAAHGEAGEVGAIQRERRDALGDGQRAFP